MSRPAEVAVVGGGLLGLTAAFRLACGGVRVTVYERERRLGGLAATTPLGGVEVDRFYHVVLPTDHRVRDLAAELRIGPERFRFRRTGVGFYHAGRLASMSSLGELLTFPGLRPADRVRLGAFVARCQAIRDHAALDDVPLEAWLRRTCGDRLWDALWRPLLDSKFDGRFDDLPATYLWARTRRMSRTRDRTSREVMGTIDGGYAVLVAALRRAIEARGGIVRTATPVTAIVPAGGRFAGVVTADGLHPVDHVLSTLLPPHGAGLLAGDLARRAAPDPCRYLGVVCSVLRLRRSVSPYYALYITDRRVPLTSVVETTHVVDPQRAGGTLLYLPRYVLPDSPQLERPARDIHRDHLAQARRMLPGLRESDVLAWQVARASHAEPVHVLGGRRPDDLFPAPGLAVATTAHVYPELVNGQSVIGVADRVAAELLRRLAAHAGEAVAA
jgi:protoporphyrinogen oxidase